MNRKHLEIFIKILISATFFVPLIVLPSSYIFPFIVPKIIWFRSLTLLMLGTYILLLASDWSRYRVRLTPLNLTMAGFLLSFGISTFVGVDWYRSFWDNHERMLGLFTIFHYVIYYFIITSVMGKRKTQTSATPPTPSWKEGESDWKWLLRVFLGAGALVMFIGILQKANPELLLNRGSGRVSATLGNSIYYSGYGLFLFFTGLLLALKENIKKGFWFWYAGVGSLLGFLGIFLGGTRGALLGLLAGLGVLCFSYLLSIRGYQKTRTIIFAGLVALVLLGSILFVFRQNESVKNIPGVGRLLNASLFEGTGATRLMAWGIAAEAWQERPVFGWGPNNYYYAFNKYYRPQFLEHGWGETWFDNAHSVVMNTLAVQGAFGILFYLSLFGVSAFVLIRGFHRGGIDAHILSISLAFLSAHLIAKALVFEDPTSYLFLFFFLAFVNNSSQFGVHSSEIANKNKASSNISSGLAVTIGLVILLLIYATNINPARANQATLQTIRALYSGQADVSALYEKASTTPTPHIDDIRNDFARSSVEVANTMLQNNNRQSAEEILNFAYEQVKKNFVLHPWDIRINISLSQLLVLRATATPNPAFIIEAEKYLEEALELSPKRQQVIYALAGVKFQLGKSEEAIALLRQSVEDNPKIAEGWQRLVMAYQELGDEEMVKEVLAEAGEWGIIFGS